MAILFKKNNVEKNQQGGTLKKKKKKKKELIGSLGKDVAGATRLRSGSFGKPTEITGKAARKETKRLKKVAKKK